MKTLLTLLLLAPCYLFAQQVGQYSQYMCNKYLINPSAFFENGKTDINMNYRSQWAGFEGAPKTFALSFQHHLAEKKFVSYEHLSLHTSSKKPRKIVKTLTHSIGGYIIQDNFQPFKKTSVFGSYSVNIPVTKKHHLSLGGALGFTSLQVDQNQITVNNQDDKLYNDFVVNAGKTTYADINLGAYFHTKNYYIGYSIFQVAPNKIQLGNETNLTLNSNHFLTAGYYYNLNEKIQLAPSFLMKRLSSSPSTWDFNVVAKYNKKFWGGIGYRTSDALIVLLGADFEKGLKISYSYDYSVAGLDGETYGSHEVTVGLLLKDSNKR
jgi:type IX secretion system PorP/SprF family membrane protein